MTDLTNKVGEDEVNLEFASIDLDNKNQERNRKPAPQKKVEEKPQIEERWTRVNGFDSPFHPLQLISWFVFFYDLLIFFVVNMISLSNYEVLVGMSSVVYLGICSGVLFYAVKATKCDPSDPTIKMQRDV